jgi:hypothetical protein
MLERAQRLLQNAPALLEGIRSKAMRWMFLYRKLDKDLHADRGRRFFKPGQEANAVTKTHVTPGGV